MILSDYGKGVLGAERAGRRDRAARAAAAFRSMSIRRARISAAIAAPACITPNLRELALAARMPVASDAEIIAAATKVHARQRRRGRSLATRSEKGMVLVEASGAVHIEAARAREVFDVSGAGDTVIAVLALAARRRLSAAAGDAARQHRRRHRRQQARHRHGRTRRTDARTGARRARQGMAPRQALQRRRGRDAGAALEEPRPQGRVHQRLLRYRACRPCRAAGGGARAMRPADRRAQRRSPACGGSRGRNGRSTAWRTAPR